MSETKDKDQKLSLSDRGRLSLKKSVETGQVRQSFSHGRSKVVQVERRKKRNVQQGEGDQGAADQESTQGEQPAEAAAPSQAEPAAEAEAPEAEARGPAKRRPTTQGGGAARGGEERGSDGLTPAEREARLRALEAARQEEERRQAEAEEKRRRAEEESAREEAARHDEEAEAARQAAEAFEAERTETETAASAAEEAPVEAPEASEEAAPAAEAPAAGEAPAETGGEPAAEAGEAEAEEEAPAESKSAGKEAKKKGGGKPAPAKPGGTKTDRGAKKADGRRRSGKLSVTAVGADGESEDRGGRSLSAAKRQREKQKKQSRGGKQPEAPHKVVREVTIPETITVQELANRMAERSGDVIKALMRMGVMATINHPVDADTAELVAVEFGHTPNRVSDADVELGLEGEADTEAELQSRPPVVTVMGHVDHGKTSLLDALRKTDVTAGEAGGITQHIGAYQVMMEGGSRITFIDTPGHEAFTAMRARGAGVTDIVVLVVGADDGVQPQTIEAIRHAKAAEVPIVVAINKMDKPDADSHRVRHELMQYDVFVEDLGGEVLAVDVSAKNLENLTKLEEAIVLQAEMLDLKANPNRAAQGVVVEAKMERGRGSVATVLVQRGTLTISDVFVAGMEWGRVRALINDRGQNVKEAGPCVPVEVLGLQGVPEAGDEVLVTEDESRAREVSEFRQRKAREAKIAASAGTSVEQMFDRIAAGEQKELPVVIKGDVQGSVEAIAGTLEKLGNETVKVRVLHAAVGGINESDVNLAKASDAVIIGFSVRANRQARELAKREGVEIRYYNVIYDVADDVKKLLAGMLEPTLRENIIGYAEVRQVFQVPKVGRAAGCMVTEGNIRRGAGVRLLRDNVVIHEGRLSQLKRYKDDVRDVRQGYECGVSFDNYNDIEVGDFIECYQMEEVAPEL